jgi:hypothetical protein
MACLHNLAIGVLSRAGPVNLTAVRVTTPATLAVPLATLGITHG